MARPHKTNLDYFSLDIDYSEDPKFIEIVYMHGDIAELIVIDIFRHIYKNMYFVDCNRNFKVSLAVKRKKSLEEIDLIINTALEVGLFNRDIFEKYNVLTSNRIQKQILMILKKSQYKTLFNINYIINKELLEYIKDKDLIAGRIEVDVKELNLNTQDIVDVEELNLTENGENEGFRAENEGFRAENALNIKYKNKYKKEKKDTHTTHTHLSTHTRLSVDLSVEKEKEKTHTDEIDHTSGDTAEQKVCAFSDFLPEFADKKEVKSNTKEVKSNKKEVIEETINENADINNKFLENKTDTAIESDDTFNKNPYFFAESKEKKYFDDWYEAISKDNPKAIYNNNKAETYKVWMTLDAKDKALCHKKITEIKGKGSENDPVNYLKERIFEAVKKKTAVRVQVVSNDARQQYIYDKGKKALLWRDFMRYYNIVNPVATEDEAIEMYSVWRNCGEASRQQMLARLNNGDLKRKYEATGKPTATNRVLQPEYKTDWRQYITKNDSYYN